MCAREIVRNGMQNVVALTDRSGIVGGFPDAKQRIEVEPGHCILC
jgi:hypothetical protein